MTTKQEFNCIFCKDVFDNKEELQDHFRKHGDPQYKKRFEVDTQATDERSKEKAEMVSCDVCSQIFPTISKAITHKHKVHPDHDAKYFCPWCGKLFTMKHLFNVHVQSSHGDQDDNGDKVFHCDCCSVDFYNPPAMINHNKFFHRQDTDLPDIGHSKKVKFCMQEIMPIYYCAFCGEEYDNKVNLIKHMTDDHSDENQSPDEVLKCPLCDAVFYHLDAYDIHLTFHSSEDMYSVKNEEFSELADYSLETVPPIIEKVETLETEGPSQDTDAESTMNAVGIEKFLELAMDPSEDSSPVKVKKHKKHKKSKKAAITLDEFLSMNQDVFGEGLDFQGVEELPTRVVKKRLKSNKKPTNALNSVTSVELEKLKKAGIVIKKKIGQSPTVKGLKVKNCMPAKGAQYKTFNNINPEGELKTSSEVLTKLINQSNNQIKIVKKVNTDDTTIEPKPITKDDPVEKNESHDNVKEPDHPSIDETENPPTTTSQDDDKEPSTPVTFSNNLEDNTVQSDVAKQISQDTTSNHKYLEKACKDTDYDQTPKPNSKIDEVSTNLHDKDTSKNESDQNSDNEFEERAISDEENFGKNDKGGTENREPCEDSKSSAVSSLSTLKRLSHLITVKPVSPNKITVSTELASSKITDTKENQSSPKGNNKETSHLLTCSDRIASKQNIKVEKDPTLDALKNLSKNITIKSLSTKRTIDKNESEDDSENESEINATEKTSNVNLIDVSANKNLTIKKIKMETTEPKLENKMNSVNNQVKKPQSGKSLNNKQQPPVGKKPCKIIEENADNSTQTFNTNLLKRLTSITTKPIINNRPPAAKQTNTVKQADKAEAKEEEIIEIFDIDDSEDENENTDQAEPAKNTMKSMDALKNISKNITVKSLNQQSAQKNIKLESNIKVEKQYDDSNTNYKDVSNVTAQINNQNKNTVFKNALQGLCKNITIKSTNTSLSQSIKSEAYNRQVMEDNDASDSDSGTGNIKITEVNEDISCNEDTSEEPEQLNNTHNNPIIESPDDSHSDNDEIDEKPQDIEDEIKASTVQKCFQSKNSTIDSKCLNNLMNISKNITIKSLSKTAMDKEDTTQSEQMHETTEKLHNQRKKMPIKSAKLITQEQGDNMSTGKNSSKFGQIVDHSTQSLNQRISAMNQVNTVNKEVTVKTIQTKTVIQEITTTVTKTIKTVKQEVRNTCHNNTPMLAQRVQGMRPSQPKNLQGVVIRHAAPNLGVKTSNTVPQIRPACTVVRPSKQVIPVRPGGNSARPINPRMAVGKKVTPSPSPNKQIIGKPLKISPTAMTSSNIKRPNTEDVSGPFSCFKKPKESLIPDLDIPIFANTGSEGTAQFTATSHTTSSNFTSTTKMVKGKCVTTAKQMKSEVNATAQQISRLNNTTGIKVRSNQAKQIQVQEKSETSAMKRNTLEAIQRLQKQGLLVKKPRVDTNEGNGDSDHDDDKNLDYPSGDEPDH